MQLAVLRAGIAWILAWIRVLVLCSYPILGAAIAFYFSAFSDQGVDLLLDSLPQPGSTLTTLMAEHPAGVIAHLLLSAAAVIIAALSIWWPARLLVRRDFPFFPIPQGPTATLRKWLPRVLGTIVVLGVAVGYGRMALRFRNLDAGLAASGWALAALLLCVVLSNRRNWYSSVAREAPGSALDDPTATEKSLPHEQKMMVIGFCCAYIALALAFAAVPVALPRAFGGTALIFLGVGGIAFIATMVIAYMPLANGHPTLTVVAAAGILLCSTWLDNHQMRRSKYATEDAAVQVFGPGAYAQTWATARQASPCARSGTPLLFVAAAGGGIRAGYWTARVLEELSAQLGRDFDCSVFAMSGVSGGSLGIAGYVAFNLPKIGPANPSASAALSAVAADRRTSAALGKDYLSPAVAGLLFYDAAQRVFPIRMHALDRSRGLESAFQEAFDSADGQPFRHTLRALGKGRPMTPMVFLNATVVEDGRRAIASNVDVRGFVDTYDLTCPNLPESSAPTTATISLARAVHNSARFTYVSPAGRVSRLKEDCSGEGFEARLVDGGYFENSGAATLVQLVCLLSSCDQTSPDGKPVPLPIAGLPILLLVRNSPGTRPYCEGTREGAQCLSLSRGQASAVPSPSSLKFTPELASSAPSPSLSKFMPELTSPLRALLTVREQRERISVVAAAEEFRRRGGVVIEAYLPFEEKLPEPPLGWSLSSGVRAALDDSARSIIAACRLTLATIFSGSTPTSGCENQGIAAAASKIAMDIATKKAAPASSPTGH